MRKILLVVVLLVLFLVALLCAFPAEFVFAGEVPTITPDEFNTAPPEYAAWYWQLLRYDSIAAAIWTAVSWGITKIAMMVRDYLIKRKAYKTAEAAERVFRWCLVAADDVWNTTARAMKAANGGKLTEKQKNQCRDAGVARAWELIQRDGKELLKNVSKDTLPYLIDQAVQYLKTKGKTAKAGNLLEAVPPPLPDLSPLASFATPTAKPASIGAVCG